MTPSFPRAGRPWLRYALWLAVPLAMAWALRGVGLTGIGEALRELSLGEWTALAGVNVLVVFALATRWWILLRSRSYRVPLHLATAYRLAGFAVSYFTPGTQFGGEPLQIHLVHERHGIPTPAATASVVLDKSIELAANFGFLAIGLTTVVALGLEPRGSGLALEAAALGLLLAPLVYLVIAARGGSPVTGVAARLGIAREAGGWRARVSRWLAESEAEIGRAAAEAPMGLIGAGFSSVGSWFLLLLEWTLAMRFLGISTGAWQVIAVVTAARLALFVPLPGAVGALEAALLFALTRLGFSATQALSLALVIRLRDVVFGGLGLWLGGWLSGRAGGASKTGLNPTATVSAQDRSGGE